MPTLPKVNYLNNRDILREIHKSKNSFSSYIEDQYHQYDIIVSSLEEITELVIEEAKQNRAKRITETEFNHLRSQGKLVRLAECTVDHTDIPLTDLVFRIMTYDHIPPIEIKKKNPRRESDHYIRVNFPPFQHWKFSNDHELICVGKSHWQGDLDTGEFCIDHGQITNELAKMILKLCERYATRGNVRSYTYVDEMQNEAVIQLIKVGLQFNEAKSNNPFAYFTQICTNSMIRVINAEKRNQNMRDDILEMNGLAPSYTRMHENEYQHELNRNSGQ